MVTANSELIWNNVLPFVTLEQRQKNLTSVYNRSAKNLDAMIQIAIFSKQKWQQHIRTFFINQTDLQPLISRYFYMADLSIKLQV